MTKASVGITESWHWRNNSLERMFPSIRLSALPITD